MNLVMVLTAEGHRAPRRKAGEAARRPQEPRPPQLVIVDRFRIILDKRGISSLQVVESSG